MRIDPSIERSLIFKRQSLNAIAEYQSEFKDLLNSYIIKSDGNKEKLHNSLSSQLNLKVFTEKHLQ